MEIDSKVIDGKNINRKIGEELFKKVTESNLKISLGILCIGSDKASHSFINVKKKFGEKYGFVVNLYELNEDVTVAEIKKEIIKIENENNALIVQLPLPEKFKLETEEILETISIKKDVDNLTGKNYYQSPIVLALSKVLTDSPKNIKVAIVGLGKVVGIPIREYCESKHIEYSEIGRDNYQDILKCNVVISGVGQAHFIKKSFLSKDSILIDYGCSYFFDHENNTEILAGDFDPECFVESKMYTPVPGGMGPIVVACLFENVYNSAL